MGNLRFRLHSMFLMLMLGIATALAQQNIRYVRTGGDNSKDGTSWANAKKDIQDAINDLVNDNLTGEVWVAAGTYRPTESTESSGSQYYKSFKIPAGITVRGGFPANPTNGFTAADRTVKDDKNFGKAGATGPLDGEEAKSGVYVNKTILSGDLNASKTRRFSWNSTKQQFDVTFFGNSYHVVWFAMNGFNETTHRANPLEKAAKLEGCVVEGGHAYTRDVTAEHPHIAYGGGIYMVANSFVYNCEVRYCDASRNGGGIYMDGGGIVRRTYVHDCQALGIGTEWGLGGGICENGSAINNPKTNPVVVAQSAVTNCVGRIGGGMALTADQTQSGNKYSVVANSTLVNNNTAAIEAGGVYTYKGGGLSSMTIVNNKCNGSGITQNGVVTGRTGGVYNRDAAYIGNCVIWGNKCETNNDVQYASSRTSTTSSEKTHFYYNALSKADNTDWSAASKLNVLSLSDLNHDTKPDGSKGFPLFFKPTASAGYLPSAITDETLNWTVSSESFLTYAGISTVDLDYEGLTPAPSEISYDMQFGAFNSRPTIGALVSQVADIAPATNVTYDGVTYDYAFFVDPSFVYSDDNEAYNGVSWTLPARFLGHVLDYIADQNYPADKKVAIFVKQGTVDNTRLKGHARIRQTSLDIPSNVSLFGSFSASLTGTAVDKRNPVATPTVISGKLLDAYKYNIAHLINIENAENVTIDGFKLTLANAASTELANTNKSGAAITLKGSNTVHFKNVTVSNSQAELGTAVYADASTADFENCIFHNNTTTQLNNSGIVYATNDSHLTFNHCDVLRNVGHASYLGSSTTNVWKNSIFYGNMDRAMSDTNEDVGGGSTYSLAAFSGNTAGATGSYCMFDSKSASFASQFGGNDTGNEWQYNLQYAFVEGSGQGYPRFINPTKNAGYSERGDETYYGRTASFEPHNNNPIVNMGEANGDHTTWGTDIMGTTRDFGGLPDIGAVENHLEEDNSIENAYKDGQPAYGTQYYVRDYRNEDGTIDFEAGGNGMSWKNAINGNAYYYANGKHGAEKNKNMESGEEVWVPGTTTWSETASAITGTVVLKNGTNYLVCNGTSLSTTNQLAGATEFIIASSGGGYTIQAKTNDGNYYLGYTSTDKNAALKYDKTTPSVWYRRNNGFANKANGNNTLYLSPNGNQLALNSFTRTSTTTEGHYEAVTADYVGISGLQYAVNNASEAFVRDGGTIAQKHQVWVAAGTYTKDPETNDLSCFVIRDGVDVYGAFPKTGNPGMDQRQALVSQYVHVQTNDEGQPLYDYNEYETILEPVTKTIVVGAARRVLGQEEKYNPDTEGIYEGKDFVNAQWNGFTLRNGVLDCKLFSTTRFKNRTGRNGGAGAAIYKNVTLKNVIITNNTTIFAAPGREQNFRAGGLYMDGGTLDAAYIINNLLQGLTNNNTATQLGAAYGGGMYMYSGTVFNSVIANNRIYARYADGAGAFMENANFFNNTIVNNRADGTSRASGGIAIWTDAARGGDQSVLNMFNSIIVNNEGKVGGQIGDKNVYIGNAGKMILTNCLSEDITNKTSDNNSITFYNCLQVTSANLANLFETTGNYADRSQNTFKNLNLRLKGSANAINAGIDSPTAFDKNLNTNVTYNLADYTDMDYADRIQDCRIDIGAYEYNGANAIQPDVASTAGQAIFYVTPDGKGKSTATDPENAACAAKLQKVLDAAGRYKYLNPGKQIIVKVANSNTLHEAGEDFTYYATRTTDATDQDVRIWSVIVPRGVEVWGGYTDIALDKDGNKIATAWSNTVNGFYTKDGAATVDHRNITKYPTYFDSYYYNKEEHSSANTYHVVAFTDRIFDKEGTAYTKQDFEGRTAAQILQKLQNGTNSESADAAGSSESLYVHMSEAIDGVSTGVTGNVIMDGDAPKNFGTAAEPLYASNRAVVDGIFITGGNANGSLSSATDVVNVKSYGGAAIVTDYAYIRNCIMENNSAINGGALALTHGALVTGSIIKGNVAEINGGGIYVFENGTRLSNGTVINTKAPAGQVLDYNMPHVITTTITANKSLEGQGGGVWFTNDINTNVRFNSVAVWQNEAIDQANVYGMVNPEQAVDDETEAEEFYPFCYSVIQNMRASGTNNQSVNPLNREGIRFVKKSSDIGQPAVDQYVLAEESGSKDLVQNFSDFGFYGLTTYSMLCSAGMPIDRYNQLKAAIAIAGNDLLGTNRITADNNFVEAGARALAKMMPAKQMMLRLFVANPEDVDTETAGRFMQLGRTATKGTAAEYYSQEGSSFAYPFNSLQDALDYIKQVRNGKIFAGNTDAQNLPFEILVGKGTYFPKKDLNGGTKSVWAATFAIPEGVTIIGGFAPTGGGTSSYYGRYYKPKASIDKTTPGTIYNNVESIPTARQSAANGEIGRGNYSADETVTVDGETITFQQWHIQDIADRRAMNDNNKNGIIEPWEFKNQTIISGNAVNGESDGVYHVMTAVADANAVGNLPKVQSTSSSFTADGYHVKEEGQQIRLNGLIVTGGNALTYLSTALDEYGSYIFYQGAGLQVDGNRYNTTLGGTPTFHNSAAYGVGYRDIPVSITNCQFRNNIAGYGGAISSNGSLSLFASSFEQNLAIAQTETPKPGQTWTTKVTGSSQPVTKVMYPGQGGAILATYQLSAFNTLFANNEARLGEGETPTIALVQHPTFRVPDEAQASRTLRAAGGAVMMGSAGNHHIVNCNFVRNKANAYPAVFTMNPTVEQNTAVNTHDYSQILNTVAWGNEVNSISSDAKYQFASKLLVNVGKKDRTGVYNPEFAQAPGSQADLDGNNWMEAVWFCAYEKGNGFTPNNASDLRDKIIYSPQAYAPTIIKAANEGVYQNCNIQIVSNNNDVAGPNFGSPSLKAGYDGYTEGADWSPARINRLTDNGNGWIKQSVDINTLNVTFENSGNDLTSFQGAYPVTHYISELPGAGGQFPEYKLWLSLGNEKYMQATNDQEAEELFINGTSIGKLQKNLPRISPEPSLGADKAYIDIGVYEYIKQPLLVPGSEVDVLWVSTQEHPDMGPANGATWFTPTSDLQRAIETLLSSRNGHKKEIRIMEGEYAPVTPQVVNIDGKETKLNAFVIDTKKQNANAITPYALVDGANNEKFYAQALTIKGGYSADRYFEYDPNEYKTVIRQNEASEGINTDYLVYVADPTVRYASGSYTEANQYGAIMTPSMHTPEADEAKTMPIQIDGITLINDKANAGAKGSAICYPDVTGMTAAHSVKIGGKLVYYETKEEFDKRDANGAHNGKTIEEETEFAVIDETGCETNATPAKFVITKSQIIGSGNAAEDTPETASAVYIGKNGGSALVYNTVFHSNYGMPLDAYNTQTVNNTFALNAGIARLQDVADITVKSEMHNTVLWMNNNGGKQFEVPGVTVQNTTNKTTNGDTGKTENFTYNSFTGGNNYYLGDSFLEKNNYNSGLADDNTDLIYGPSFTDPDNTDIEKRSFDIKPNFRLLNKGMDKALENPASEGQYYILVVKNSNDYALDITSDKDVLFRDRLNPTRIDIGAYEFQNILLQILYVDPNKSHNDSATGENWDMAFGYGDIQNAIDLAAIYHTNHVRFEGYVFIKGASATNKDLHTNEDLILRDGVTVYGSILANYNDHHNTKVSNKKKYYDVTAYIAAMDSVREGIASSAANKTIVSSIRTIETTDFYGTRTSSGVSYDTPALIDGFVISPADKAVQPTAPVLDITNPSSKAVIVARNIIVAGNDLSGASDDAGTDINVAQISNGLLYEVLMRDNKPKGNGAVLNVSNGTNTKGYAVNATVEGKTIGADGTEPVDGKSTVNGANVEQETQIYNSITNSIKVTGATVPSASPEGNKGISGYFYNIADPNLNYQLTETSKYIDACEASDPQAFLPESLAGFINYAIDRDLLGNPRLLTGVTTAGRLDRGAFETWKVENSNNIFHCGTNGTIAGQKDDIIAPHFYPHDGSVVYLMNGQSLVSAPTTSTDVKPLNPGFMLVKEGANFYSNGRPMNAAYLAVERKVRQGGSIVSMPYAMQYKENVTVVTNDANDELTLTPTAAQQVRTYNGDARSDWKYIFKSADSPCWTAVTAGKVTAANTGVFYMPEDGTTSDDITYRFTGRGTSMTDYIYTETADAFKTVALNRYDDAVSTAGAADFTDEKNMGWNCIGLPYLVSEYKPYEQVDASGATVSNASPSDPYRMNTPRALWLYYDGATDGNGGDINGNGGYYSVNSWEGTAAAWHVGDDAAKAIWTGEGIFVQTATLDDTETLTFYRPQAPDAPAASPAKMARFFIQSIIEAEKAEDAVEGVTLVTTEFFTSDGKKLNTIDGRIDYNHLPVMSCGTAIIVRKHYSDGTTKTQKFIF